MRILLQIGKTAILLIPTLYKMLQIWWDYKRKKREQDAEAAKKYRELQKLTAKERLGRIKAEADADLAARRAESFDERKRRHLGDG